MATKPELYAPHIWAKMVAEEASSYSDAEIERCLSGCVAGRRLIVAAKALRDSGQLRPLAPNLLVAQ